MTRYDVIQKIEKTLNNPHTETQKQTNNGFRQETPLILNRWMGIYPVDSAIQRLHNSACRSVALASFRRYSLGIS